MPINLTSFARFQPRSSAGAFIKAKVDTAVEQAVTAWAERVLETAQQLVPVRTGDLRGSGHVEVAKAGSSVAAAVVFDSGHSVYVEFGTGQRGAASEGAGPGPYDPNWAGMPAQPYLRPAFDAHRNEAQSMTRETVTVAVG